MVFVVSAAPQFGRPQVHMLDEEPVPSQSVEPLVGGDPPATSSVPNTVPGAGPTGAASDQINVRTASKMPRSTWTTKTLNAHAPTTV